MKTVIIIICLYLLSFNTGKGQNLKSVIYDFDGFDLAQTNLPEGDYAYGALQYLVAAVPVTAGTGILGDRCLQINLNWNLNYAAFGRGISRFIQLDYNKDYFNFYILNPSSEPQQLEIVLAEDDNQSFSYEASNDDSWRHTAIVPVSQQWQLVSIPLFLFSDVTAGGNSVFDAGFNTNEGMLLLCEFKFTRPSANSSPALIYLDLICISEGALALGNTLTDLPEPQTGDYCRIGAFKQVSGENFSEIPLEIESFFNPYKKITYVHTFLQWSQNNQLLPNALPGNGLQQLIDKGYKPILTWEPLYRSLPLLDAQQPNLQKILNGTYDSYLDAFGDVLLNYTDTIIIRLMHEFDGDWYPWSISQNAQDPLRFASAFRYIVDRIRSRGVTKVQWMWCPNSDYAPYQNYNWLVYAYPGDAYVDYTGTDVYNAHYPNALPWWRSFRWLATECCHYLSTYFPTKPIIICELGCRERQSSESPTSQSKANWFFEMDRQLESQFSQVRGLVFFHANTGTTQDWKINSSAESLISLQSNIWNDAYYFPADIPMNQQAYRIGFFSLPFPNPAQDKIYVQTESTARWRLSGIDGQALAEGEGNTIQLNSCVSGYYLLELWDGHFRKTFPLQIIK